MLQVGFRLTWLLLRCHCCLSQEVIDLRHQVAGRLRAVAQGRAFDQLWLSFDTWRQWALLKNLGRLAVQRWRTKQQARCVATCVACVARMDLPASPVVKL